MIFKKFWYFDGEIGEPKPGSDLHTRLLVNFGKGVHKAFRASGTRLPFFEEQFQVITDLLNINGLRLPVEFDRDFLRERITRLITRNRIFKGSVVHLLFISESLRGDISQEGFIMAIQDYGEDRFILNQRGLKLGWLKDKIHPGQFIMSVNGSFHQLNITWGTDLEELKLDAGYLTNISGNIVECTGSSLFLIRGEQLYTPSDKLGLLPRAIRSAIIRQARKTGMKVNETDLLEPKHLDAADEIFIAGDLSGIRWVVGHGSLRYYRKYSEIFNNLINREWAESI